MERIYTKARREQRNRDLDEILAMLDSLKGEDFRISKQKVLARLDEMVSEIESRPPEEPEPESAWDFRVEKAQAVFAEDQLLQLRPFTEGDERFYFTIRDQYKFFASNLPEDTLIAAYQEETQKPSAFFCTIVRAADSEKLGYIALKNTSKDPWELAIELDQEHCGRSYGSKAILLFLQKVRALTGRAEFQFLVEVDNLPCQSCMKKVGAKPIGLHNLAFETEEEAKRFEEENLALITEHMQMLAKELDVAPEKLLSHVLDYRLNL